MNYFIGKDYPWLCPECQGAVDTCLELVLEGPDTDDEEAPCTLAHDLGLLHSSRGEVCFPISQ